MTKNIFILILSTFSFLSWDRALAENINIYTYHDHPPAFCDRQSRRFIL